MKKITRKGSGRTQGAFSFVTVTLKELNEKFADPNQPIVVGRKFAEPFFPHAISRRASEITNSIAGSTPNTQVTCNVVNLND